MSKQSLNTYLLYSFLILVLLHFHGVADLSYRWTTLGVDLVFATTITLFSEVPEARMGLVGLCHRRDSLPLERDRNELHCRRVCITIARRDHRNRPMAAIFLRFR
jgi:hypothetical protein